MIGSLSQEVACNATFNNPYFYEYYDLNSDPFQLTNGYDKLSTATKDELHSLLITYGECAGTNCFMT